MKFSIKQRNDLYTGVQLEAELLSSKDDLRKFICVIGYNVDDNGEYHLLDKYLNSKNNIIFEIDCYEIPIEYFKNNWEVSSNTLKNRFQVEKISSIEDLEKELSKYIDDFSSFVPSWDSDNIF